MFTFAMPQLLGRAPYNQVLNMVSFWTITSGVVLMALALTFAGVLQTHLERVMGQDYMEVQQQLGLFYWMRLVGGLITFSGFVMYLIAVLMPGRVTVPRGVGFSPAE
jgi:nitric oxide reductase subunit B